MKRWPIKPLGEVAQVTAGDPAPQRAEDFSNNGIPFVRMQDVGRFGQTTCLAKTKDQLSASASPKFKRFPAGSILVPKSGASIRLNHRAILGIEAHVVSHLAVIVPQASLNTRFVYYWLCGIDLSGAAHDADLPSMKTSELAKLQLPVPPLAEQERIVKLLDEADELRKLRAQADRRTADLIPALFHEMFGDPITNYRGWPTHPVSSFVAELQGGHSVNPAGADEATGRFRILKISAVTWGEFQPDESKPAPAAYEPPASHLVRAGDLLFSRANTTELVAATSYVFDTPPNLLLPDKLWRFVWKEPRTIEPLFVWWLFQAASVRRELGARATGTGGSMKNISKPKVMTLEVPLPPLPLQKEFAQRVGEIRALQAAQAASRQRTEHLFQSMLHRAFNQEL